MCVIKYMIRKTWGEFVEGLSALGIGIILTTIIVAAVYATRAFCEWLGIEPKLFVGLCLLATMLAVAICGLVGLYREARRHCATENEPACEHEFFRCQVPAGDSCVGIYHQVCKKCHWDQTKGVFMPDEIWRGWAVPQLEEMRRAKC